MERDILEIIAGELGPGGLDLNYSYLVYRPDGDPAYPYVTGEYSETSWSFEDGHTEGTLLLEAWTRGEQLELIELKEKIKQHFRDLRIVRNKTTALISYGSSNPVRTEDSTLKEIQLTLDVKAWESEE
jgi:hypothetical protein